jgi:hypothetical protein
MKLMIQRSEMIRKLQPDIKSQIGINECALELDNGTWMMCKQIIGNPAEVVIKEQSRRKRSEWFDKHEEEATLKKILAYKGMIQRHYTRKAIENYKQLRREEKRIHKKNMRLFQEEILKELNSHNETRMFYRIVNDMIKGFKPRILAC